MKIAILGDTHFGARGDNPYFHKFFRKFYSEVFFPYLKANDIEHVIQLGDVFDRRKYINFNSLNQSKEYFFDPLNKDFKSWLLIGNHDTYFKNTNDVNSLRLLLREYTNINLILNPTDLNFDSLGILLMPWICADNTDESMQALITSKSDVVMGHFEIQGFEMHKGAINDEGLEPNVFDRFDMALSGHFHTRSTKQNITYVGTPYEMIWSDAGDQKGFHILDTETRELLFVPNPYSIFHKVWYNDVDKTLTDVIDQDYDIYKGTIVKVIVTNKNNPHWFDVFIDKIEKAGAIDIQVVDDHLNLNLEDDSEIINEAEDTLTILNKYVNQLDLQVNKQRLDNLLRTLYNEALTLE